MMKIKAILFDLDGTLLDTLNDLGNAVNRVLSLHHFPVHPIDAYRHFVGDGLRTMIVRALPAEKRDAFLIKTCMDEFDREYAKNWNDETSLYPGIPEMLDAIQSRGLKMAVFSNKPHKFTQECVEAFFPKWEFEIVMGIQSSIPHKPDPTGALAIARHVGVAPESFLYLGDTGTDMQTACAARMYPVGALWGFRSMDELKENGAEAVVTHPSEVEALCN